MRSVIAAALVLCGTAAAQAQPPAVPTLTLTLAEAQERAVKASHRLAQLRALERASAASIEARRALDHPSITALAGYTRTNHVVEFSFPGPTGPRVVYPDVPNNYQSRLDLQWPIYSGGRTDALQRVAEAEAAAAGAEIETARADLRLEVARAYWALVTAGATVSVVEQSLQRSATHIEDVRANLAAGLVAPNEVASADARHARTRMLLAEATGQRDSVMAELARLVGEPVMTPIATVDALLPPDRAGQLTIVTASGDGISERATQQRSELRVLARRIDVADAQRAVASTARRPTIAVTAGADYAKPNARIFPRQDTWQETWDAGVQVRWPLWDGGRSAADAAQATALAAAARERLDEFRGLLGVELRQRTLDLQSGLAAFQAADAGVRAAEEARRVVTERYRAGVIAQGELLDAELALLQAELDRTRSLAGIRLAEARLARAQGE
jgi:outer membrane protein TolC